MSGMRKLFCSLLVMVLAAFALPSVAAPAKIFSLNMSPQNVAVGTAVQLKATYKNETPNGNSVINSVTLVMPQGLTFDPGHPNPVSTPQGGTASISGNTITVINMPGIPAGGATWYMLVWVVVPANPVPCGSYQWSATAFTGNSLGGTAFAYQAQLSQPFTNVTCSLVFRSQPASAAIGDNPADPTVAYVTSASNNPNGAPVAVALVDASNNVVTGFSGTVTLTKAAGSGAGTLGGTLSIAASSGVATFSPLTVSAIGSYTLTASSSGFASVNSNAFTIFAGSLGCDAQTNRAGNLDPTLDTAYVGNPDWGLVRGPNTDGATCVLVPYTFNFDGTNDTASFIADKTGIVPPQLMSVEYVLLWKPVNPDGNDWASFQPKVSWGIANPVIGTNDYVPGLACLSDDLSYPANASIMPTIPNVAPFNTLSPATYPQYQPGVKAEMCIAQQGWTSVGGGLIQYWDKVIDQSDGHVTGP